MTAQVKSTAGVIGIFMFISGMGLMIIADGIDILFGMGLLFFLTSLAIALIAITWSIAGSADKAVNRFINGDSD